MPGIGDLADVDDTVRALGRNDYWSAAQTGLAAVVPFVPGTARKLFKQGGRKYVTASDGSLDFGVITPEISAASGSKWPAKPIRVEMGDKAFGAEHMTPARNIVSQKLGYPDALAMFEDVARNFDLVIEQPRNNRLMLVKRNGRNRYAIVSLQEGEDAFYGMTTSFAEKKSNATSPNQWSFKHQIAKHGGVILWERGKKVP